MKLLKILALLGMAGAAWAGVSAPPAGNYIANVSTFGSVQAMNITSATIRQQLYLPYAAANQCLQTDILKNVVSAACVSGGGGGVSSLAVNQNGVAITSPTIAINALSPPFLVTSVGAGTTAQWTLDSGSVTLLGNSVNGISQIVQTDFAGALPALSAANLTNIPSANLSGPVSATNLSNAILLQSTLQAGATFFVSSGTLSNASGYPLRVDQPGIGAGQFSGINFSQQGAQKANIRVDYFNVQCSDINTPCTVAPYEIGWTTSSTPAFYFNSDGRLFAFPPRTRMNGHSSVVGGSLIVGGTGNFNYTDVQDIGDGNLLVNNGVIASTMSLVGAGDGKIIFTVGNSTYAVTYTSGPISVGQCLVATSTSGAVEGVTCGGGGSSGSPTLAVTAGVSRSSPTTDVLFNAHQFSGSVTASSMTVSIGAPSGSASAVFINGGNSVANGASNVVLGDLNNASGANLSSGANNTCLGALTCTGIVTDQSLTAVGTNALKVASGTTNNTAVGSGVLIANTSGSGNTAIGKNSLVRNVTGSFNSALGENACDNASYASSTTLSGSICIGDSSYVDMSHVASIGSTLNSQSALTDVFWNGRQSRFTIAGASVTWHSQSSSGTDVAGGDLGIAAGQGTGTGSGGNIYLQVAAPSATGGTQNALYNLASLSPQTGINLGMTSSTMTVTGNLAMHGGLYVSTATSVGAGGVVTGTYQAGPTDQVIFASASAGAFTVTLPPAGNPGQVVTVYKADASTQIVTVRANGSDFIDGTTQQFVLNALGHAGEVVSGAGGWWGHGIGVHPTPSAINALGKQNASVAIGVSSSVYTCILDIPAPVALTGFRYTGIAMASPGQIAFGLYDKSGNLVVSTGPVYGSVGIATVSLGSSYVNLPAGQYYIGTQGSNTAISMAGAANAASNPFCEVTAATAMGMPSTVTVVGGSATGRNFSTWLMLNGGRTTE